MYLFVLFSMRYNYNLAGFDQSPSYNKASDEFDPAKHRSGSLRAFQNIRTAGRRRRLGKWRNDETNPRFFGGFLVTFLCFSSRYGQCPLEALSQAHFVETLAAATHLTLQDVTNLSGPGGYHA